MGKFTKVISAAGIVAGSVFLANKDNRRKIKEQMQKTMTKLKASNEDSNYVTKLGKPADTEDAAMVDEGAMTSMQYYNVMQEKEKDKQNSKVH